MGVSVAEMCYKTEFEFGFVGVSVAEMCYRTEFEFGFVGVSVADPGVTIHTGKIANGNESIVRKNVIPFKYQYSTFSSKVLICSFRASLQRLSASML